MRASPGVGGLITPLNFVGSRALDLPTGADPVTLNFSGERLMLSAAQATLAISDFVLIQGSFAFQKASFSGLRNTLGLPLLNARGFTVGASNVP